MSIECRCLHYSTHPLGSINKDSVLSRVTSRASRDHVSMSESRRRHARVLLFHWLTGLELSHVILWGKKPWMRGMRVRAALTKREPQRGSGYFYPFETIS